MPLKKFAISIDEKVLEDFKDKLAEKYNRKDGFMGVEIEMAIRDWMKKGMQPCPKRQYTKTPKDSPPGTLDPDTKEISIPKNKKINALTEHITNLGKNRIGLGSLKKEISAVTDTFDPRSIDKYLHVLENMGVVEPEGVNTWLIRRGSEKDEKV